jgi:uncharacterized membrane protein
MSQPPAHPGDPGDPRAGGQGPGGYPPPPPGYGTPPPPPPGYGAPLPGYGQPPAGYSQAPSGGIQFSVGDAFNWAWNKFTKNAPALIVPMLIYGVAMAVIGVVVWTILMAVMMGGSAATSSTDTYGDTSSSGAAGAGFFVTMLVMPALFTFFFALAAFYIEGAFVSGCLEIADGKPVSIGSFLRPPRNFGSVIVAALLVAIGTAVGYALCILPGIVFLFFSMFTIPFVIDRSLSPVDALKASFSTVNKNLGTALLACLVTVAVGIVGGAVVCVGTFISIPVSLLIMTYTFRRLSGGQIAPLTVDGPPQPYQQQPYQQQPYQQQPYQQQQPPQQPPYQPPPPYQS